MTENAQTSRASAAVENVGPEPFNTGDKIGLGVLGLLALAGLWLMVAPFLVGYQGRTSEWTNGTVNDFAVGIALTVLSLVAVITVCGGALAELARNARHRRARSTGA